MNGTVDQEGATALAILAWEALEALERVSPYDAGVIVGRSCPSCPDDVPRIAAQAAAALGRKEFGQIVDRIHKY